MAIDKITTPAVTDDSVTLAKMAPGTDGQIITYDASGNPVAVGPGTDGQVLTSTGAGSPPAFEDVSGGVTFKQAGTNFSNSLLVGTDSTGTLSSADRNTGVGIGVFAALTDRKSVVQGKRVDIGGRRVIKKKKEKKKKKQTEGYVQSDETSCQSATMCAMQN